MQNEKEILACQECLTMSYGEAVRLSQGRFQELKAEGWRELVDHAGLVSCCSKHKHKPVE